MDEARARGRDGGAIDRRSGLVVFDTAFVDMSEKLDDPVDLLFGVQSGGCADINVACLLSPPRRMRSRACWPP